MKAALIQLHSRPTEIADNVAKGKAMYHEAVKQGAELIAFPELWSCGYYLETFDFKAAVRENEWIIKDFCESARKDRTVIVLPLPQEKDGRLYIGLYVIESNGEIIAEYQKSFLWGREQRYFTPGEKKYDVIDTSVGKIGVLICYDAEFPEPSRILALRGAQLILVPSVWSIPALNRWRIQLPARALDNTVFVAGINNVGEGACGHTVMISPDGSILAEADEEKEEVLLCGIEYHMIDEIREKIPYLKEYDRQLTPGGIVG